MTTTTSNRAAVDAMPVQYGLRGDPWAVLVSCICLNRSTIDVVRPVLERLFLRYPTPRQLLGATDLDELLQPTGLAHRKDVLLRAMSEQYLRRIPIRSREEVLELPGVGDYAADAYELFCLGRLPRQPIRDSVLREYAKRERWTWIQSLPRNEAIRERFATGVETLEQIADDYGVTRQRIWSILRMLARPAQRRTPMRREIVPPAVTQGSRRAIRQQELLAQYRRWVERHDGRVPTMKEMGTKGKDHRDPDLPLASTILYYFGSMRAFYAAYDEVTTIDMAGVG